MKIIFSKIIFLFIAILFVLQSCVYDYTPKDLGKYENKLVVYGLVSNELSPIEVYLTRTKGVNEHTINAEDGANIRVLSSSGQEIVLTERGNGLYASIESIQGAIGEEYKIEITTKDGSKYESDYRQLNIPDEIGEISYEIEEKETNDIEYNLEGYQFYIDIETKNSDGYFRYEMEETWEIYMPKPATKYWDGEEFIPVDFSRICWRSSYLDDFYVISTKNYGSSSIKNFPLNYVTNETERLKRRYCLNVKQYTMSEESFLFWNSQKNNIGSNTMYPSQPYQVVGNIKNINDPNEIVLGIFEVSGVSNRYVFAEQFKGTTGNIVSECTESTSPSAYQEAYGYYAYDKDPVTEVIVQEKCANCEMHGGNPVKPYFWE